MSVTSYAQRSFEEFPKLLSRQSINIQTPRDVYILSEYGFALKFLEEPEKKGPSRNCRTLMAILNREAWEAPKDSRTVMLQIDRGDGYKPANVRLKVTHVALAHIVLSCKLSMGKNYSFVVKALPDLVPLHSESFKRSEAAG